MPVALHLARGLRPVGYGKRRYAEKVLGGFQLFMLHGGRMEA
jgi:hypothetical protein